MATSVSLGYCPWLAGATWTDQLGRLDIAGETYLGGSRGGVLQSVPNPLQVLASSGMNVTVQPGTAIIPSVSGPANGAYRVSNPIIQTLTLTAAPSSPNSRLDLVVVNVTDNGNNTSVCSIELVTGTAGNPPTQPATPSNSILLAVIAVGSGVSSILQANIADNRFYTNIGSGAIVCPNMASLPQGWPGQIGYDVAHDRFFELGSSGAQPFKVMGFTPAQVVNTSNNLTIAGSTGSPAYATLLSASVTTDGSTDLQITAHWAGIAQVTAVYGQVCFGIFLDSTQLDEINLGTIGVSNFNNLAVLGGTQIYVTSSAMGNTPTAGSHTVTWQGKCQYQSSSMSTLVRSSTTWPCYLRVQPVTL
jgi:hypothetical protein